jgi:excisionase family DNA binding protein
MSAEKSLFGISETADRWGVSPWSVRRLIDAGQLPSVTIGARRLLRLSDIKRAEEFGVGTPRKQATV